MPKRLYRADPKSGERRIARDRRGASQGRPRQGEPVSEQGQEPISEFGDLRFDAIERV